MGNCCGNRNFIEPDLTPDQQRKVNELKKTLLEKIRPLALLCVVAAIVSIIAGAVIIGLGYKGGFPMTSGTPIWTAAVILGGAVQGLAATFISHDETDPDKKRTQVKYIGTYSGLCIFGISTMGMAIGYAGWALGVCAAKDSKRCPENQDALTALNAVTLVTALTMGTCSIIASCYIGKFRKQYREIVASEATKIQTGLPPSYDQSMSTSKY